MDLSLTPKDWTHKIRYVAIELAQEATLEATYHNHKKSVEYLLKNF